MAYSLLAHAGAGGSTGNINTTGATLIVIALNWPGNDTLDAPTDNQGNTYTELTPARTPGTGTSGGGGANVVLYYCANPITSATHTFSNNHQDFGVTGYFSAIEVLIFSGAVGSVDVQNHNSVGFGTSLQPGSVTPTGANALIVTAFANGAATAGSSSIDSGFTITDQPQDVSGGYGGTAAYLIQTAAAAVNPTWTSTYNDPNTIAAVIAVFEAGGGGNITVAASAGAFTLNAQAATLAARLAASQGIFPLTGAPAALASRISGIKGQLTVNGQALAAKTTAAGSRGQLTESGQALAARSGATGVAGALTLAGKPLTAKSGAAGVAGLLALNGQLLAARSGVAGGAGLLTLTGKPLTAAAVLSMTRGQFILGGQTAAVSGLGSLVVPASAGALTLGGRQLTIRSGLAGAAGTLTLGGRPLFVRSGVAGAAGALTGTGGALHTAQAVAVVAGALTLSGAAATALLGLHAAAQPGVNTLTGEPAAVKLGLFAGPGSFVLAAGPASLSGTSIVQAGLFGDAMFPGLLQSPF